MLIQNLRNPRSILEVKQPNSSISYTANCNLNQKNKSIPSFQNNKEGFLLVER